MKILASLRISGQHMVMQFIFQHKFVPSEWFHRCHRDIKRTTHTRRSSDNFYYSLHFLWGKVDRVREQLLDHVPWLFLFQTNARRESTRVFVAAAELREDVVLAAKNASKVTQQQTRSEQKKRVYLRMETFSHRSRDLTYILLKNIKY